jgi:hypothetical protein
LEGCRQTRSETPTALLAPGWIQRCVSNTFGPTALASVPPPRGSSSIRSRGVRTGASPNWSGTWPQATAGWLASWPAEPGRATGTSPEPPEDARALPAWYEEGLNELAAVPQRCTAVSSARGNPSRARRSPALLPSLHEGVLHFDSDAHVVRVESKCQREVGRRLWLHHPNSPSATRGAPAAFARLWRRGGAASAAVVVGITIGVFIGSCQPYVVDRWTLGSIAAILIPVAFSCAQSAGISPIEVWTDGAMGRTTMRSATPDSTTFGVTENQ